MLLFIWTWVSLGKTFASSEYVDRMAPRCILLICPKSMINMWCNHWMTHYSEYQVFDLSKTKGMEDFLVCDNRRVGVVSYQTAWRRKQLLTLRDFVLMCDESSNLQNKSAKQTKGILKLKPSSVVLLSGTPASGKYENLWVQCHLLGWNISEDLYNRQYVNWTYVESDGFFHKVVDKDNPYKNTDRLRAKLRTFGADFLKTEDCFQLPEQTIIPVYVETSKEYRRFMKHSIVELPDGTELIGDQIFTKRMYSRHLEEPNEAE